MKNLQKLGSLKALFVGVIVISSVLAGCVPQPAPTVMNIDRTQQPSETQVQTSSSSNQSTSNCSKSEIMKLMDKGFSKIEINGICGSITTQQTQSPEVKNSPAIWITPSDSICKEYRGKLWAGPWPVSIGPKACVSNYERAKNICSASGGRLPTFEELQNVAKIECGGINNSNYKTCYREKGFFPKEENYYSNVYWSSSIGVSSFNGMEVAKAINFKNMMTVENYRSGIGYVRCLKE